MFASLRVGTFAVAILISLLHFYRVLLIIGLIFDKHLFRMLVLSSRTS